MATLATKDRETFISFMHLVFPQ
jgi:molecular chaperone GrpE (heat shock protein)